MAASDSKRRAHNFKDLTGKKYGKWTVLGRVQCGGKTRWLCRCECGIEKSVLENNLTRHNSRSCLACARRRHGMIDSPEYSSWLAMKQRCNNPKHESFAAYGGNGKIVCERWLQSFEYFYADMGPKPSPSHSVDRIDGSKGYEPTNCRWATTGEQARNKRTNRLIAFNGETMCLNDWAARIGISAHGLRYRLSKGWSIERCLTTPVQQRSRQE